MLGGTVGPVPAERGPPATRLLRVQRRVLGYERVQPLRVPQDQPEPDGCAEVHDVQGESAYPELVEQLAGDLGEVVEGVGEVRPVRDRAVPAARIVGRDDMV